MYDFCIIGGGVVGCALARELSRYKTSVILVEAESDVCARTSGANSGIIHAGYDAHEGSLMSYYNILGSKMFRTYAKILDVPYKKTGSLVISTTPDEDEKINILYERGKRVGVNVSLLSRYQTIELEPNITDSVRKSLYAPDAAIINPFELVYALRENAEANGAEFKFDFEVKKVEKNSDWVTLFSDGGSVSAKNVINCAGNAGGKIARLFGDPIFLSHRVGEYLFFDKVRVVDRPVFRVPSATGKGALICPTTSGNFFIGPTGIDVKTTSVSVRRQAFDELYASAGYIIKDIPRGKLITSFSGVRAIPKTGDFIIGRSRYNKYLYNIIGICSPGLSAAPAIAVKVAASFGLEQKSEFAAGRKGIIKIKNASFKDKTRLIAESRSYGNIVCRCETVSEAEVVEAVRRGACTLDGVKKRLRTAMGRCQGGFCTPNIINILARELNIPHEEVRRSVKGSEVLVTEEAW